MHFIFQNRPFRRMRHDSTRSKLLHLLLRHDVLAHVRPILRTTISGLCDESDPRGIVPEPEGLQHPVQVATDWRIQAEIVRGKRRTKLRNIIFEIFGSSQSLR